MARSATPSLPISGLLSRRSVSRDLFAPIMRDSPNARHPDSDGATTAATHDQQEDSEQWLAPQDKRVQKSATHNSGARVAANRSSNSSNDCYDDDYNMNDGKKPHLQMMNSVRVRTVTKMNRRWRLTRRPNIAVHELKVCKHDFVPAKLQHFSL